MMRRETIALQVVDRLISRSIDSRPLLGNTRPKRFPDPRLEEHLHFTRHW